SAPSSFFRPFTPHRQATPTPRPMISAPIGPTKPHAGVIATRPAIAPEIAPSNEALPFQIHSAKVHEVAAAQVARKVLRKTSEAKPLASRLEPTLKPNQPTHSSEAPTMASVMLCGLPMVLRLPTI